MLPLFPFLFPNITITYLKRKTFGNFLSSIIKNKELQTILTANVGYYGKNPYSLSLFTFAIAQASFFDSGCYYIKGTSHSLSNYLADKIKKNNGIIKTGHEVTEILITKNSATGVICKNNKGKTKAYYSRVLIANTSIPYTVKKLIDLKHLTKRYRNKISRLTSSMSLLILYIIVNPDIDRVISNSSYTTFFFNDSTTLRTFSSNQEKAYFERDFVLVNYGLLDKKDNSTKYRQLSVNMIDSIDNWNKLTRDEYKKQKNAITEIILNKIEQHYSGFKKNLKYSGLATPMTIKRYTNNTNGSIYGFAQTPEQNGWNRHRFHSPVKNLFFASAWTYPGGGFTGTMLGGYMCANEIIKMRPNNETYK